MPKIGNEIRLKILTVQDFVVVILNERNEENNVYYCVLRRSASPRLGSHQQRHRRREGIPGSDIQGRA